MMSINQYIDNQEVISSLQKDCLAKEKKIEELEQKLKQYKNLIDSKGL
jgi:hypothetical protein